jgi:hypothetical protein
MIKNSISEDLSFPPSKYETGDIVAVLMNKLTETPDLIPKSLHSVCKMILVTYQASNNTISFGDSNL